MGRAAAPRPVRIVHAELVGGRGMSITWNDGHSTGIYSWELLSPDEPPHDPQAYAGFVLFDGMTAARHWLASDAVAENRDE
jgi:DUF971 family protein